MIVNTNRLPDWFRVVQMREFPGERMLWAGLPNPMAALRGSLAILLFAVPFAGFALFWEASVLRLWYYELPNGKGGPPGIGMAFFGLPFVVIGLVMLFAPLHSWRNARRTVHVLTDKRLVTLTQMRSLKVESLNLRAITKVSRKEKPDRSGSLTVDLSPYLDSEGDKVTHTETFYGIGDVRAVEILLREAMEKAR